MERVVSVVIRTVEIRSLQVYRDASVVHPRHVLDRVQTSVDSARWTSIARANSIGTCWHRVTRTKFCVAGCSGKVPESQSLQPDPRKGKKLIADR